MKQHKVNDNITLFDEQVEGSVFLKDIPTENIKELVNWKKGDEHTYPTEIIKLESMIIASGVNLYRMPNPDKTNNFYLKPFLKY